MDTNSGDQFENLAKSASPNEGINIVDGFICTSTTSVHVQ